MDFEQFHQAIGDLVKARWPDANRARIGEGSYDLDAYVVPVPDHPPKEEWKGTMPNDIFVIGPTQKKAGITIHVWHPNHPFLLKDNAEWLKEAGYQPMVGCLQWNRKADPDLDAFAHLLDKVP